MSRARKLKKTPPQAETSFPSALAHFRAGELDEAETQCQLILTAEPCHADSLHLLGILAHRKAHYDLAARHIGRAIDIQPRTASFHNSLGNTLQALGQHEAALASYRRATELKPDFAQAHANIAACLASLGEAEACVAPYRRAIELKPDFFEALHNLGNVLRDLGQLAEAIACHRRAVELRPDSAAAQNNLGNALQETGELPAAIECFCKAIQMQPDFAAAYYNLGNALHEHGDFHQAIACHRKAIELRPDDKQAHTNLGNALHATGQLDEAVAAHSRAIELDRFYVPAYNNLGNALREQGRLEAAIDCHRAAIELQPDFAAAHSNLGNELEEQGQFEAAFAAHERAVALAPGRGSFHHRLANTGRIGPQSPHVPRMEAQAADESGLADADRMEFHFALGLIYAESEPEKSFRHLLHANRLARGRIDYDEVATLHMFARLRSVFTPARLTAAAAGTKSDVPVFVVGMPRSGTTLVEQILASHPDIFGAGELADLPRWLGTLEPNGTAIRLPEALDVLPPDAMARVGAGYLAGLRARAPEATRIVDKLPGNFLRVGFIHLALPQARIIHVHRDPVDTCLSCFSKLFSGQLPYAYDLGELGRYYKAYETLMAHWRSVLPPGILLDVRYEDVVADLPGQARRMLDHCGMSWNDHCLAFHENRRAVQTYSATQVRRPIYASAVGKWHACGELAKPLLEALGR